MDNLLKYRKELIDGLMALDFDHIQEAADVIFGAWKRGSSVYVFGNGHSASTSEAFAADLRKWPQTENHRGVKAHALTLLPLMTAYANDIDYDEVFLHQLLDIYEEGDVAIGITCGGSKNVVRTLHHKLIRDSCILITGNSILGVGANAIWAPAHDIRIQEDIISSITHMIVGEVKARIEEHLEGGRNEET